MTRNSFSFFKNFLTMCSMFASLKLLLVQSKRHIFNEVYLIFVTSTGKIYIINIYIYIFFILI